MANTTTTIRKASSNSITPKGDGNLPVPLPLAAKSSVQIPLPRKGTETYSSICKTTTLPSRSNSITPKGDGNPTSPQQYQRV
ncbi:MAG: hypothetical protein HLUCCA11_19770 [Phormidesmis priestleyi Ana]|uniref:Uncharacterized protein n=1 Tax=Phormidesmis priestleyi Ana TaxID=1666911 RepID=A0A0P8BH88_9CYAN|nr:MAG: hypothetical protein HLUCCA11_19770 [Phormidesmis priestleyi Ana]